MVDHPHILSIASIGNLCKNCKAIVRKWRNKKSSSKEAQVLEFTANKGVVEEGEEDNTEEYQRKKTMNNGVDDHRFIRYKSQNIKIPGHDDHHDHNHDQRSPRSSTNNNNNNMYKHRSAEYNYCTTSSPDFVSKNANSAVPLSRRPASLDEGRLPSSVPFKNMIGKIPSRRRSSNNMNNNNNINSPIMFSNSSGMLKPPPIEKKLECSLEDLCYGSQKKIKITRDVLNNTGRIVQEEELVTIKVKPGWKKGTKIRFEGMGNEKPGWSPADIIFVIAEKRHQFFKREGDDLELAIEIPLVKALTGCNLSIPLLGGDNMSLTVDEVIYPGFQKIIPAQGMPNPKDSSKRGHLKVTFLVDFPKQLTREQRSDILSILQHEG